MMKNIMTMTEKVCKLYEEEQAGETREGRKAVPNSKMPDLAWDIAVDTRSQKRKQPKHDTTPTNTSHGNHSDNNHCETDNSTN